MSDSEVKAELDAERLREAERILRMHRDASILAGMLGEPAPDPFEAAALAQRYELEDYDLRQAVRILQSRADQDTARFLKESRDG